MGSTIASTSRIMITADTIFLFLLLLKLIIFISNLKILTFCLFELLKNDYKGISDALQDAIAVTTKNSCTSAEIFAGMHE